MRVPSCVTPWSIGGVLHNKIRWSAVTSFAFHSFSSCSSPVVDGSATRACWLISELIVPVDRMVPKLSPTIGVASAIPTMHTTTTAPTDRLVLIFIDVYLL